MRGSGIIAALLTRMAVVAGLMAAAGCTTVIDTRGNLPDQKLVAQIEPGRQTRAEIERMLGTPSTVATFDKEVWYYIGSRVETVSFFDPKLLERKILVIRFNKKGVVEAVGKFDESDARKIALVERETPTRGKELTVLQQLIGNVGRFGNPKAQNNGGP